MDQNQPQAVLEIPIRLLARRWRSFLSSRSERLMNRRLPSAGERFSPLSTSPSSERRPYSE